MGFEIHSTSNYNLHPLCSKILDFVFFYNYAFYLLKTYLKLIDGNANLRCVKQERFVFNKTK